MPPAQAASKRCAYKHALHCLRPGSLLLQNAEIAKEDSHEKLVKAEKIIWTWSAVLTFIFLFAWPLLALPAGVFSKSYFYWCASAAC